MGLREKVALTLAVIMFIQIISVTSSTKTNELKSDNKLNHKRSSATLKNPSTAKTTYPHARKSKTRSNQPSDKSIEEIWKLFNFPDVEYPTASTPRPHFYLQEANILQRNQVQRSPESPSSATVRYSKSDVTKNTKQKHIKYTHPIKFNTKNVGVTKSFPELDTTAKPFCYREEGAFPEVEYPLKASDTWKPNYWKPIPSFGQKKATNNNGSNKYSPGKAKFTSSGNSSSKISVNSSVIPKSSSFKNSNPLNTTPDLSEIITSTSTTPIKVTPYTTLYFDTTPSYINPEKDEEKNTTPAPNKTKKKKKVKNKKKKKSFEKETSFALSEKKTPKDDNDNNLTTSVSITNLLSDKALYITETQENILTVKPDEPIIKRNLNKLETCSNTRNQTISHMYVATTLSPCSSDDHMPTSQFEVRIDNKTDTDSCDNKVTSISNAINTVESENTDNKYSYFEDNAKNSNKSSLYIVDEEFTTDVYPDFNDNMLSVPIVSTSTISPMALIDIDEDWANSIVIDPYKSVTYPDELDQYYIALL